MSQLASKQLLSLSALLFFVLLFQNCSSGFEISEENLSSSTDLGSGEFSSGAPMELSKACQGSTYQDISQSSLRRLHKLEVQTAYTQLFGISLLNSNALKNIFAILNDEVIDESNPSVGENLAIDSLLGVANEVVDYAISQSLSGVPNKGSCNGSNNATCRSWMLSFAEQAYKRNLTSAETNELTQFYSSEGLGQSLKRILISPQFSTHLELATNSGGPIKRLNPYEVAARISFQTMGGIPDQELLAAAAGGGLENLAQVRAQVERLLATPLARQKVQRTFLEWLGLDRVPEPSANLAASYGINAAGFGAEASDEFGRFIEYIVFEKKGNFVDLMLDKTAFPFSKNLSVNMGLSQSSSPQKFKDERGGILLRPAILVSSTDKTSPIQRGVYFRNRVLCQQIPPPPDDVVFSRQDELDNTDHTIVSNRQVVTSLTRGSSCMGCHSQINPIGFVLEGFDPFGVPRSKERVFGSSGAVIAEHLIDTSVDSLWIDGSSAPASSATDLVHSIAASPQAMKCAGEVLVKTTRPRESDQYENCMRDRLAIDIQNGRSIYEVIVNNIASQDIFWIRK